MQARREPLATTVIGYLASVAVHAALVWGSLTLVGYTSDPGRLERQRPDLRVLSPELRVGLEDATAVSATWLGGLEETGTSGPSSDTAQAAFALASGGLDDDRPGSPRAGSVPSRPNPEADALSPIQAQPPAPLARSVQDEAAQIENAARALQSIADTVNDARDQIEDAARELLERQRRALQAMREPSAAIPAGADAQNAGHSGGGDAQTEQGEPSDRESEAFSIQDPLRVTPGQPAAGKGIEIRTVRPRWTHFTTIFRPGGEVTVRVLFRRDGSVHEVVPLRLTGHNDVDRPLLDAVYNWRASGERLRELPEDRDPPATLQIVLVVSLR